MLIERLSTWAYVTGAIVLSISVLLLILSATDKSGFIGYIVGGIVCLLVGAAAITLGIIASSKTHTVVSPQTKPDETTISPTPPPSPPSMEDVSVTSPESSFQDNDAEDSGSEASLSNYALAPPVPMPVSKESETESMQTDVELPPKTIKRLVGGGTRQVRQQNS